MRSAFKPELFVAQSCHPSNGKTSLFSRSLGSTGASWQEFGIFNHSYFKEFVLQRYDLEPMSSGFPPKCFTSPDSRATLCSTDINTTWSMPCVLQRVKRLVLDYYHRGSYVPVRNEPSQELESKAEEMDNISQEMVPQSPCPVVEAVCKGFGMAQSAFRGFRPCLI
jgi:hypothetical protein